MVFLCVLIAVGPIFARMNDIHIKDTTNNILGRVSVTDCNDHVLVQWSVSDNLITDHFEIERMDVNGMFKTVALVLADNKEETEQYIYKDKITLRDLFLFYRVRAVTNKGEVFSSIITPLSLKSAGNNLTVVHFNYSTNKLKFHLPFHTGSYVCRFYNIVGKMVKSKTVHASFNNILINDLKKGNYFLEIYHPQTGKRYYANFEK